MTEIKRSIEISAPVEKVWSCVHPQNWDKIFKFVKEINGFNNGNVGVGTQAKVSAGNDEMVTISYNVEVTEFNENQKIAYRRFGGPLSGKGVIQLKALQNGTLLTRISQYDDDLSEPIIHALSEDMERDNLKIKQMVESNTNF